MEFVDFHTHIYPEKIAVKATDYLRGFYDLHGEWPGTAENLLIFGKAAGISKFVVLPVAVKQDQVRKINEFLVAQNNENEEFIGFGTVHALQERAVEEIDFIKKAGLYGVKIHPDQQMFALDDQRLFETYDYMQSIGLPVLFHCGDAKSDLSHPFRLKKLLKEFPKLRVVAAHFGGWQIYDEAFELLQNEDCFFDMSSAQMFLGPEKTAHFIKTYGADKIFFGSDFPLWDQEEEIKRFMALPISDGEKEAIASKNALRFFGL